MAFLRTLLETPSPVGHEARGQRVWMDYVKPFADETFSDAYGNCVAVLNRGGAPRVMLAGHADEIALTVNYIDENGFLFVRRLGGVDPVVARAQRVHVHTANGPVPGVIGNVAPHLTRGDNDKKYPRIEDLFIDIGAGSRKEAQKLVRVGDPVTSVPGFEMLRGDLAMARAFDNRVGTFAVAEALRLLHRDTRGLKAEVSAVSNVMEEIGLFGSRQIAYTLKPDLAIIVDVTHATDYPGVNRHQHGDVRLGHGPTLTHGGGNHPEVVRRLEKVADELGIELQHEAQSSTSGTDTDAVFWTRGGIPSALISLPNRYMHSPVEIINLRDLRQIPELIAGFVRSLRKGETFKVRI